MWVAVLSGRNLMRRKQLKFPNYFDTGDLQRNQVIQEKVYQAITSIIKRLKIPYVDPKTGKMALVGFFDELATKVQARDPSAKVYISGGVVRSLLGYIYRKIHAEHIKRGDQHVTTEQILDRLIEGTPRRKHPKEVQGESSSDDEGADNANLPKIPVSPLSALGIGSDLDILIEFSHELDEVKKQEILGIATDFTNLAAKKIGLENASASTLKNSIVPTGDVNEYQTQIQESSSQGGSSLDWLAFPVQGGEMRMPNNHPKIMEYFFQGNIEYLSGEGQRDPGKQTIRGIRSLLEIPFLDLTPDGKEQLLKELRELHNKIERGDSLSPQALKQFNKMIRNARFEGAGNRFARPRADDEIAQLISKISALASKNEKDIPLVPEFTQWEKIENRQIPDKAIDPWLMPVKEFHEQYTHNGKLYHGTPEIDYLLAMIRNGLIASIPGKQGGAAFGTGFYTTPELLTASVYASTQGAVLELPVNKSEQLRVLDYEKFINTPEGKKAQENANSAQQNINQYLAERYHVDVIIRTHPLIMNVAAVTLPKKVEQLVQAKISTGLKSLPDFLKLTRKEHQEFYPYLELAQQLGINIRKEIGKKLDDCLTNFKKDLGFSFPGNIDEFLSLECGGPFYDTYPNNQTEQVLSCLKLAKLLEVPIPRNMFSGDFSQHVDKLLDSLNSDNDDAYQGASAALKTISPNDHEAIDKMVASLNSEDRSRHGIQRSTAVIKALDQLGVDNPDVIKKMVSFLKHGDYWVGNSAYAALKNITLDHQTEALQVLVDYLTDREVFSNAYSLLMHTKLDAQPMVLQKLVTLFSNSPEDCLKNTVLDILKESKLNNYPHIFRQFVKAAEFLEFDVSVRHVAYRIAHNSLKFIVAHNIASSTDLQFVVQKSLELGVETFCSLIESVAKHRNCNDEVRKAIVHRSGELCVSVLQDPQKSKADMKKVVEDTTQLISKIDCPALEKINALKKIFDAMQDENIPLRKEMSKPSFFHEPQSYQEALKAVEEAVLTILNQSQPGELDDQTREVADTILGNAPGERLGFGKTASQNKIAPQK